MRMWAESVVVGLLGGSQLYYVDCFVFSVSNVGKQANVGHSNFNVACILDLALSVEHLIQLGLFRILYVDYREPLLAGGNVGVGADEIQIMRIRKRHNRAINRSRLVRISNVYDFQTLRVSHERVAELHLYRASILDKRRAKLSSNSRLGWVADVNDDQSSIASHVSARAGNHYVVCSVQNSVGVPGQSPLKKVVPRI